MFIEVKNKLHKLFRKSRLQSFAKAYPDLSNQLLITIFN